MMPMAVICLTSSGWTLVFDLLQKADPDIDTKTLGVPPIAASVLGTTVGFLLVMKTSQGCMRWWEGRGHFGPPQAVVLPSARLAAGS